MKRALVVSGGGSRGSYAGGLIENFIKLKKIDWDIYVASSTGSLIIPSTSIGDIDKLKEQYTSVNNSSIFKIAPFNQKGKLRILNALWRVITSKTSLGNASRLRKKISEMFTEDDFNKSILSNKEIFVCVSNLSTMKAEFKLQKDCKYNDFCDWMFASCSVPLGFEVVEKEGYEYVDGGVFHMVPIQKAVDSGADIVDIIILREKNPKYNNDWKAKNMFNVAARIIDMMNIEIMNDDIMVGQLAGEQKEITLNFYYTPYNLTNNCLIFDKEQMLKWWELGYNYDKTVSKTKSTSIAVDNNTIFHSITMIKDLKTNRYKIK